MESAAFLCARRFACPSTLKPQHAPYLDVRLVRRQSMPARDSAVSAAPRCVEPRIRPSLPAATLQEAGQIRHIGLSNFPPSLVEQASQHVTVFCNEVEYHPYLSQHALHTQACRMDYLLIAYCPLAQGR
ncbi:MAG TPA: hypothetical protein EYN91_04870, partial [Candidatus Melainabacteria bacterium]|nr:hypothetical protein [Candidatus Melainabacteria bacterium]